MKYYLVGFHQGKRINLDACSTMKEATRLLSMYSMAYGKSWTIDIIFK